MTLAVEVGRRFDLQLGSLDIAVQRASALQLKQILDLDRTGDFPKDIRRLAVDIPLDIAIGADDHLGRTMDIPNQGPVDTEIPVAGNVSFHGGAGADQAGTSADGFFPSTKNIRFGLAVKHINMDFSRLFSRVSGS